MKIFIVTQPPYIPHHTNDIEQKLMWRVIKINIFFISLTQNETREIYDRVENKKQTKFLFYDH